MNPNDPRQLDAAIAERLFGWTDIDPASDYGNDPDGFYLVVPYYSHVWDDAGQIFDALRARGLFAGVSSAQTTGFSAWVTGDHYAMGKTGPEALARAALKALARETKP